MFITAVYNVCSGSLNPMYSECGCSPLWSHTGQCIVSLTVVSGRGLPDCRTTHRGHVPPIERDMIHRPNALNFSEGSHMCIYKITHSCGTRSCYSNLSMLHVWLHSMGNELLQLRQLLIRKLKCRGSS